jgi:hypothetical protein
MENYSMYRIAFAGLAMFFAMTATVAQAEIIKPVKDSKPDLAGAIFQRKDAVKEGKGNNATTDVVTFTSKDAAFQTGVQIRSGP